MRPRPVKEGWSTSPWTNGKHRRRQTWKCLRDPARDAGVGVATRRNGTQIEPHQATMIIAAATLSMRTNAVMTV